MSTAHDVVGRRAVVLRLPPSRPDQRNARNPTRVTELNRAVAGAADRDGRVIALGGQGRAWSAGHDQRQDTYPRRVDMARELLAGNLPRLRQLPGPTIARVRAYCVGRRGPCGPGTCDVIACDGRALGQPGRGRAGRAPFRQRGDGR